MSHQNLRCLISSVLVSLLSATALAGSQPNILFILTDDQGYGDASCHGHPLLKTPHIDRLREQSVAFDNFYVSPSCSPTRAALLTGRHEFEVGVTHTLQPREHLSLEATLLPELLRDFGYKTGFIGKWHLGGGKEYLPQSRGFDWSSTNNGGPRVHFDPVMVRNGKRNQAKGFREDLFFDEAMAFIEESGDQPFFCYLATYSPHTPLDAPEEFIAPFRGKVSDDIALYLAMIANIDTNVGRILAFLDEKQLAEDTIVIFMNDNGVTTGLDTYNAGMRGSKCTIWEGGSRAMSFWRWTGKWKPRVVTSLTAHLDVFPTLCNLAGADIPVEVDRTLDGFDLLPLLDGTAEDTDWHADRILFQHVARWPSGLAAEHRYAMAGARQGDYLLLRSHDCGHPECKKHTSQCTTLRKVMAGNPKATYTETNAEYHWGVSAPDRWSLFHSKDDPGCENDLASALPEKVETLAKAYDDWWDDTFPTMIKAGGDDALPEE